LDVLSADIQNAYLTAPISEKYYVQTGLEFPDSLRNRPAKVVPALYGLPVAGSSFRSFLAENLKELGYESTKGDADVYMRPAVKKNEKNIRSIWLRTWMIFLVAEKIRDS